MIQKDHFLKLHLRKQIYKIAETLRKFGEKDGEPAEKILSDLAGYSGYMDGTPEPKLRAARSIIVEFLTSIPPGKDRTMLERANMSFHAVMALIGEAPDESGFLPRHKRFDSDKPPVRYTHAAILDNLRSPFNTGSIFRSSDCFGVGSLALCGITPAPPMPKIERTAMGTVALAAWSYFKTTSLAISHYRKLGFLILGVETIEGAASLFKAEWPDKSAFVFGNEEFGLTEEALLQCERFIDIPLVGSKNSLNVASAFAVVMAEAGRRKG
ncbi:MAG: TrmH family RNA methyltransferase [Brevinematales bacterium]|jgi:tRNA(Leu) C34 or U34 (ribose-2'-O)-methylase TrmL